ncbi:hypothetical protein MARPU_05330 [Marichromatium purpuratum 984]|uniref:Nucleotidyltransferase n=2 Tax=Marichromatium purpuratum TaxID=37487 RepID=W0DXP1_MARPU|nr:hypothetical protein MARPU_05330 [Marichromatium purpuratum 984]
MSRRMAESRRAATLLVAALRAPERLPTLADEDWDLLLRIARHARLLGRLDADLGTLGLHARVPERICHHLESARQQVAYRQRLLTWEVDRVLRALEGLDVQVVALKGVAYVLAGVPAARGRPFADVDLLIPMAALEPVEQRLRARGWLSLGHSAYDEHYYRDWMHEIPPLRHAERDNEIDIHHRLLPRTSRFHFDPAPLFIASRALEGHGALRVLDAPDMVLHAVVHLFLEGDAHEGLRLRDLVDVWDLIRHFEAHAGFWDALLDRAELHGLRRPLFHALRQAQVLFALEPPARCRARLAGWGPVAPVRWLMDRLVSLALFPDHAGRAPLRVRLARLALYARAHWLRMPSGLLLRHLGYKGWLRLRGWLLAGRGEAARR